MKVRNHRKKRDLTVSSIASRKACYSQTKLKSYEKINFPELVEFQQSCCILHIACKNLEDAFEILKKAKESGWQRSGIIGKKRNIVEELIPFLHLPNIYSQDLQQLVK